MMTCGIFLLIVLAVIIVVFVVDSLLLHLSAVIVRVESDFNTAGGAIIRVWTLTWIITIAAALTESIPPEVRPYLAWGLSALAAMYFIGDRYETSFGRGVLIWLLWVIIRTVVGIVAILLLAGLGLSFAALA